MTMAEQPLVTGPQVAGAPAPDVFAGPVRMTSSFGPTSLV